MNEFTPVQLKAIQTWTEQRDKLLREIGSYSSELNELRKSTKEEGLALADLHRSVSEARGRLAEIEALETRTRTSLPIDIAELEVRKSRLEGECVVKELELQSLSEKYELVIIGTRELDAAHAVMKDQAAIVNSVAGEIIEMSKLHASDSKVIMSEVKTMATQVIERGNENIAQTKIILEKLPKYIFELQKPIPIRRAYKAPHGTIIRPEPESDN